MKVERDDSGNIKIRDIKGDMGEPLLMSLMQQEDGDVIISIADGDGHYRSTMEFCTLSGGGRHPVIAKKLRELIKELMEL